MRGISLFSGAGGDTLGLERAGVNVVGFVEWEQAMINTHLRNFPDSVLLGQDIRDITAEQLAPYVDTIDVLFAGFPCQGFSHAGKKDTLDARNDMFREFVRVANIVRPKWVIGENVKRITRMKTADERDVPEVIKEAFQEIGYAMHEPRVLKAEEFGVPQKRERCFFVGSLEGIGADFSWDGVMERTVRERVTLDRILEGSLEHAVEITEDQARAFGIMRWIEADNENGMAPSGAAPLNLRKCLEEGKLSFGKRISPTHSEIVDPLGFAKTLICTYNRMPRMFVAVRRGDERYLRPFTIREAQQIQGFPRDYIVTGSRIEALKQIGNAVPPQLVEAIVNTIRAVMG